MGKKMKKRVLWTVVLFAAFIVFTALVTCVDVRPIGPQGSKVGFAAVNQWMHEKTGYRAGWHKLTELVGYVALASVAAFALVGLAQLIRGGLRGVNYRLWLLAVFYVVVLACYVLFEKLIINYRPVILDEGLEASYPSSHTMLSLCCMGAAMMQFQWLFKRQPMVKAALDGACVAVMVIMVAGRLLAGVHWLTDIAGGVLLSGALLMLYHTAVKFTARKLKRR